MRKIADNWPKLALIFLPLLIATVDAAVLISERLQPETEKAIKLVKESNSRKENFTVQQYLYSTVFYSKDQGEAIEIEGWRASLSSDPNRPMTVEFIYRDAGGLHVATWGANLKEE